MTFIGNIWISEGVEYQTLSNTKRGTDLGMLVVLFFSPLHPLHKYTHRAHLIIYFMATYNILVVSNYFQFEIFWKHNINRTSPKPNHPLHYLKLVVTGIVVLFQDRMRVGFMTYDSKINFYNIKGNLSQPQQLTVGDVDDMFVPLVDGLLCSLEESETVIDSLLEQIPIMFGETRETETILAPVIQAGKEAFKVSNDLLPLLFYEPPSP